ncbi:glycosyltransferase family 2 protein [Kaistella sp.]|uniref:glycosyltransferase family 2 protein n=1 Tax=Kaistella sp. TaxID=2782235 RepID=UPI002F95C489
MLENSPLVSVIVITYNSEKYVLETLESIQKQTYSNVELIISDDGSSDNTLNICENWLSKNNERFIRTEIIKVVQNTGIPGNCNRGVASANGEWIKLIAGDDCLTKEGISEFVGMEKSESHLFQTVCEIYKDVFSEKYLLGKSGSSSTKSFFSLDSNYQYRLLKYWNFLSAPTVFFKAEIFNTLAFDEDFKKIEDYPFWIIVTKNGYKIGFADVVTVRYRIHSDSVQKHNEVNSLWYKKNKFELTNSIRKKYYKNIFFVRLYDLVILNLSANFKLKKYIDKLNVLFRFFATYTFSVVNKFHKTF